MDLRTLCAGGVQSQEGRSCESASVRLLGAAGLAVDMRLGEADVIVQWGQSSSGDEGVLGTAVGCLYNSATVLNAPVLCTQ